MKGLQDQPRPSRAVKPSTASAFPISAHVRQSWGKESHDMLRDLPRSVEASFSDRAFRVFVVVCCEYLALAALSPALARGQQTGSAIYFANDEIRLAKLMEKKAILEYRAVFAGERRFRETFFDGPDLVLYREGMFYRVKEGFDGQAVLELYGGGAEKNRRPLGPIHSVVLAPDKVLLAREGKLDDQTLPSKRIQALRSRDVNKVQLVAEYARY